LPARDRLSFSILLAATVVVAGLCIAIALPFVPPLTWAVVLAVLGWPLHIRIRRRIVNRNLAALASVLLVALIILTPVIWISIRASEEVSSGVKQIEADVKSGVFQAALDRHPRLVRGYNWLNDRVDLGSAGLAAASSLKGQVGHLIGKSIRTIIEAFICLFMLFFFFRDRAEILHAVRMRLPLSAAEIQLLLGRVKNMIRATVFGRMLTAIVQGVLGGLMFWILGIEAALLWTVVMAVLSMIPALGSIFVWAPAAAWLAISGHWVKAIILAVWGSAVIGTIDNILYPLLVGRDVRIHTLLLFIALLGGVLLFGATGLVLGPVLMETGLSLIEIVRARTETSDESLEVG
jgi:predicted PurR-regulated permease PerM